MARQATDHPGGQNLVRYPEGSNGGVHRGPDKFPRRNAIRAVFLHAMAQDQEREHIDPSTGKPERVERLIRSFSRAAPTSSAGRPTA